MNRVFYAKDIEDITAELEDAKSYGEGAADEWRKGLDTKGKERVADAARWEKWEGQMRLGSDLSQVLREYETSSFPHRFAALQGRPAMPTGSQQPLVVSNGKQTSRLSGVVSFS